MATTQQFDYALQHKLRSTHEGGAHEKWSVYVGSKKVGWCMRSRGLRGHGRIPDALLSTMARQLNCSTQLWKQLLACPGTWQNYLDELVSTGTITQQERDDAL